MLDQSLETKNDQSIRRLTQEGQNSGISRHRVRWMPFKLYVNTVLPEYL